VPLIYNQVFYAAQAIGIGIAASLLAIPPVIIFTTLMRKKQTMKKVSISALTIVGIALTALFIFVQFMVQSAYNGNILMFVAVMGSYLVSLYFITIMDKRTDKGLELYGKVLGLKNFIELAEKSKLEMLVHDDP
jgi:drug/metabolite transporter (DMT)-like permease